MQGDAKEPSAGAKTSEAVLPGAARRPHEPDGMPAAGELRESSRPAKERDGVPAAAAETASPAIGNTGDTGYADAAAGAQPDPGEPDPGIAVWAGVRKYAGSDCTVQDEEIAVEFALTIRVDGEEFATLVCTPSQPEELVTGFLASEGVIRSADELRRLDIDLGRGFAYAELSHRRPLPAGLHGKRWLGSCCGTSRQFYLHSDVLTARTVTSRLRVPAACCMRLLSELHGASDSFARTGGLHNAALCDASGILVARTDIGRHNALDKLYGWRLRERVPASDKIIAFSGRISSEVVLKAAKIGVPVLLSKSAPSDLALRLAHDLGVTAAGFIRDGRMNVYTHPERITG
ncbi:formate dehydrogenase accessory sulfurtransferase FdhD [Paenibacillus ginsengihumi]|uniref:formate dehydrogenase accessory sulfurtransferase FdhD n=1 Tax=Paenibacillus ginsengihumi TaxID=431596 RepID=UPI00036AD5E6|nr:formate dehydrogenase accessory sulfurtransferase FdhD [Paenibacillus ginsengihumi]